MLKTLKYQLPAIVWSILVLILCFLPGSDLPEASRFFPGFDKVVHLGFFFVLAVLLFFGKIRQQNSYDYRILTIIKITLICVTLGGGIELLQWKVFTYRDGDWWDFFVDMVGYGMGVFGYLLLHRKALKPLKK
ncbi:MAG: VanZ family protein [Bacteroidetes bacterium]|nr:VanZ family protein [Bacteroidota bacterium]MBU1373093.1 VanZ family protein [Bacteroidota bacterium]MBU1484274.1 VanZ family protein [Bacteroidota bacterium]MBU1761494.1 VanZ family protein [Bacteroidota bacterium]MBU2047204.1 VanZ family protein [Bacteroidota bacterium]